MAVSMKGLNAQQTKEIARKNAEAIAKAKAEREAELMAEIEVLRAKNDVLKKEVADKATKDAFLKVANGGGISLYGLGRFPITLYVEQWEKVLDPTMVKKITDFMAANMPELKKKGEDEDAYFARTGKTKKVAA